MYVDNVKWVPPSPGAPLISVCASVFRWLDVPYFIAVVPDLFGTRNQFLGRQFSPGLPGGWFQDDSSALGLLYPLFPKGFPGGSDGEESDPGDPGSIPGSGRSPGEGNGYPLRYSCLENSMDRGAWQATVHGSTESDTTERLSLSLHSFPT